MLSGKEASAYLDDLVRLRLTLFCKPPYLYQGTVEEERDYLVPMLSAPNSFVVFCFDHGRVIGATTALPLNESKSYFYKPFVENGLNPKEFLYISEAMVDESFQNQGIGKKMLTLAKEQTSLKICGIMIDRNDQYEYSIHSMMKKWGHRPHPEISFDVEYRSIDGKKKSHHMVFWY